MTGPLEGSRDGLDSQCPYGRHYFQTALGPVPYDRQHSQWLAFSATIADHIVAEIKPRRVLDVGCAMGFLVEALRDRGVEAFGIDISAYAIGEVRPDIRPYCRVTSAVEAFDGRYDLVTCIEVLEHLTEEEGRLAIANICRSTGDALFSSTPNDFTGPTHVNVRPRSWWITRFAEHGLHLREGGEPERDELVVDEIFRGENNRLPVAGANLREGHLEPRAICAPERSKADGQP